MESNFLKMTYWHYYSRMKRYRWFFESMGKQWVMGRYACLGRDVLKLLNMKLPILNEQKGRVDYILEGISDPSIRVKTEKVVPFLQRADIAPLIGQQEIFFHWKKMKSPKVFFMDSFAELTDQMFIHKEQAWKFCCHYSDLCHDGIFDNVFHTAGLLPEKDFLEFYRNFFIFIRKKFGEIPIIFLHYPIKLEGREKFRKRHDSISTAILKISEEFSFFYFLRAEEGVVDWPEERFPETYDFPYHYNSSVYEYLAEKVKQTGVFE